MRAVDPALVRPPVPRWWRVLGTATALVLLLALIAAAGFFRPADNALQNGLGALQARSASGQLHLVEMDAASLAAIRRWPWSRDHYARVVDRLNAAGAASIAFDVDFSAPSEGRHDRAFAQALARSRAQIILPTFSQAAEHGSARQLDALPIPALRPHGSLASVLVLPDHDSLVRSMPLGTVTAGVPRPSLSAQIAKRSGAADALFPIDFAIEPGSIPRHSFTAIEQGRFDAEDLRGKHVLIGATAIEMGDRYGVPRHGVLPGVVIQALAAETLFAGIPTHGGWVLPLAVAGILAGWLLAAASHASVARRTAILLAGLLCAHIGFEAYARIIWESAPALALLAVAGLGQAFWLYRRHQEQRRCTDADSGLPNARAFHRDGAQGGYTVAAMIGDYDALKSVVGTDQAGVLAARLAERLASAGAAARIYRIDDRALAWHSPLPHYELTDALLGLRTVMRSPLEVAGRRIDVNLAFGIAENGAVAEAMLAASTALREGTAFSYHEAAGQAALAQQVSLMGELDQAILAGELRVFYQPKLELATDTISSVEALIRWDHPQRGFLRPDSFIPLAEQSDRIDDLTLHVLDRTIADLREWCGRGLVVKAAVNISARLLSSRHFIAAAEQILAATGVPRDRLIFEVTESATIEDPAAAVEALHRFRALGITISMDDYGTGQSSLTYLRTLPLSELKIDRSFVQWAHRDQNDALLVRSTVQLAHELGLKVVAEGVEDAECLAFLRDAGCDYAQGYLVGKPVTAAELVERLLQEARQAA